MLHVAIDAHGRVIPEDDRARAALGDRAGTFVLLPTVPDLLVARRIPVTGGEAPRPRCVLTGDLGGVAMAELVGFIHQSRISGLLSVAGGGTERTLVFKDGEVRGARSSASGERLGEVAVRLGYVQPGTVDAAAGDRPIGKALVERGLLTAAELWKCIHEQVAAVFHGILLLKEGVFALTNRAAPELASPLSVSTQALLMDGIRRVDELALFRARIPGPEVHVRRREGRAPGGLAQREQEMLGLVAEPRRVADLARALRMSEFDATKILYHLVEAGHVEVLATTPPPERRAPTLTVLVSGIDAILRLVTAEISAAGSLDAFVEAVRSFLSDPLGRYAPLWSRVSIAAGGTIDIAAIAREAGAGGPEVAEALRELMLFYLFEAAELLPADVDERLAREVRRRYDALGDAG